MAAPSGWPSIPSWQASDLQTLAASGQLSGVNPEALAVIDKAESGGSGGGINSSGYGGFFGLGVGSKYPAGTPSASLLSSTSEQAFDQQAVDAASAFNAYLGQQGGDPVRAEEVYQSGSASGPTEGSKLMAQYLGGSSAGGGATSNPTAAQAQLTGATATNTGLIGSALGLSGISPLIVRGGMLVFGGILIIVALVVAARGGLHAASSGAQASRQARQQTREQVKVIREEGSAYRGAAQRARGAPARPPRPAPSSAPARSSSGGAVSGRNLAGAAEDAAVVAA